MKEIQWVASVNVEIFCIVDDFLRFDIHFYFLHSLQEDFLRSYRERCLDISQKIESFLTALHGYRTKEIISSPFYYSIENVLRILFFVFGVDGVPIQLRVDRVSHCNLLQGGNMPSQLLGEHFLDFSFDSLFCWSGNHDAVFLFWKN